MRWCTTCGARFSNEVAFCPNDGVPTEELAEEEQRPDPLLGRVIDGRYRIESQIGEGGMGIVYLASHTVLGKRLALKVLRGDMASAPEVVQRFIQEAQAATSIGHENIIDISDFGQLPDRSVYFVMELLEGQALTDLIARGGSVPVQEAVTIIRQIASALGAAHARGIVHRDLKPDNVFLLQRGERHFVKVLDFGIAKVGGAASKLTKTGMVFGTPHYMSPEQAAGQSVDRRTDIYALGVIMYEMFTGKVPFDADTFMGILSKHMFEAPVPPSQVGTTARLGALEDLILKCLAKKPEERYQSMEELVADLDRIQGGGTVEIGRRPGITPPDNLADSLEPVSRTEMRLSSGELPQRRGPLVLLAGAAVVLLVGGGVAAAVVLGGDDGEEPVTPAPPPPVAQAQPDAGSAEPEQDAGPDEETAERRMVRITSTPAGAQVLVEGAVIGNTPVAVPVPSEGTERVVEIRQPGYESQNVRVTQASPEEVSVTLEEEERVVRRGRRTRMVRRETAAMETATMETTMETTMRRRSLTSEVVDPWE